MKIIKTLQAIVWLSGVVFFSIIDNAEANSIKNTVSVETVSDAESSTASIKVRSSINGEVVEDYQETSTSGNIFYESTIINDNFVVNKLSSSTAVINSEASQLSLLKELLNKLLELLTWST